MSDGNKFDINVYSQPRLTHQLSLEEMGNVLLDAMQGTLICLDSQHTIVDVSKTIKHYFGYEEKEIIGQSVLLLVEDSERDGFCKFLDSSTQLFNICSVRIITTNSNEYRQVKVHQKKKFHVDPIDVHSTTTTTKQNGLIRTILVFTLDDSSYIDINLFDIHKQEFYTKINLTGEIIFDDHRAAVITGYLPHELISRSIFNFVYQEDRLVKLHALWKCITTGTSKLQWRFNTRNGSIVFLHTEYKLISNHLYGETIVARNEVLSPSQQSQFDDLQSAWRHQCTADIRGNGSTFKIISSADVDNSTGSECRISVPSLNMYFSTTKLQSLNINGNIFQESKLIRPLSLQDYIQILINHNKHLDNELIPIIQSISTLTSKQKQNLTSSTFTSVDSVNNDRTQIDFNGIKRPESESIIRGMLDNSIKSNPEKGAAESSITLNQLINENGNSMQILNTPAQNQSKSNSISLNVESIHQQHHDFMKKYKAAKIKLESQLEIARGQEMSTGNQPNDVMKRNIIINKLSQLENIKNKHLSRILELKRQALNNQNQNSEEKDLLSSLLNSSSNKLLPIDPTGNNHKHSHNSSTPFYSQQRTATSLPFESGSIMSQSEASNRSKSSLFDEYLNPSSSSTNSNYLPTGNGSFSAQSYVNLSYRENPTMTSFNTNSTQGQQHRSPFPY